MQIARLNRDRFHDEEEKKSEKSSHIVRRNIVRNDPTTWIKSHDTNVNQETSSGKREIPVFIQKKCCLITINFHEENVLLRVFCSSFFSSVCGNLLVNCTQIIFNMED